MVSLLEIYNIKESTFNELKKDRDPARGNKGKSKEKDFYLVNEPADSETGNIKSKVVYKRSFGKMVADLEAEAIDLNKLAEENPDDIVLYKISEELKELYNKFRTHVRKKYPEEYKNIQEDDIDEASMTGTGASFTAGSGAGYMTPNAFKKKKKK